MRRIFFASLLVLVLALPGWAATYYVNGSGGQYTDPQGSLWGVGNDNNPGTLAAPKATIAGGCSLVTANNDNLKIAPATYTVSAAINVTNADRTGIIIEGADPNNPPVIDGSGFVAYDTGLLQIRGGTEVRYLNFVNINKTSGYNSISYALYVANAGANIKIHHCRFSRNERDIACRGASSYEIYDCKFIETYDTSITTYSDFKTSGSNLLIHHNKFYGYIADDAYQCYLSISGTNGVTSPTISIYNNIIAGGATCGVGIIVDSSYDGIINIKNNAFTGLKGYAILFYETGGATRHISNNAFVSGGWPVASPGDFNQKTLNCSDSAPVIDTTLSMGSRGTGYIIVRKDDGVDSGFTDLNYTETLAAKMASKGFRLTLCADYADSKVFNTTAQIARIASLYNAEIACHSYSHAAMDNDSAHTTPLAVAYTGAGTCNLQITSTGTPPNDSEILTLTESTSGNNITINLATGVITGDTTSYDLKTWQGLLNYLNAKSYLTCSEAWDSDYYTVFPNYALSRGLGPVTLNNFHAPAAIPINKTVHHYYEMTYPRATFQADGITISNTFAYPFFQYDGGAITDAQNNGYTMGLGTFAPASFKMGQQLEKLQMFEVAMFTCGNIRTLSDADLRAWTNKLCDTLENRLLVITLLTHGGTGDRLSMAQWDIVFDEISKHNVQVVSASQLQSIIAGGGWQTSDNGKTYTRSSWPLDDNFRAPDPGSPLIDAGVNVGLTQDFAGNPIVGTPDIGAYEYQGGPGNSAPAVAITSPVNGSSVPFGTLINFSGTATDAESGDLTASLTWTSSIDGSIGTGGSFSRTLSAGTHTITASATDPEGLTGLATITITVRANTAPVVAINGPADGATIPQGANIVFMGTATDAESGDLTANLTWTSSRDGNIGTGGSFSRTLSAGTHTITASASDPQGLVGSAHITITVQGNTSPVITITSPTNGAIFAVGSAITFSGTAIDAESGNLTASLTWTSSIDGAIGSGGSFSRTLSAGTHLITASATDPQGLVGSTSVSITVQPNTAPVVTITSPTNGSSFSTGTAITFSGTALDAESGNLSASLTWTSSIDGPIGTGASFSRTLSLGTHIITASATDPQGLIGSTNISITVTNQPVIISEYLNGGVQQCLYNGSYTKTGQSFTGTGSALKYVTWHLAKYGAPTGSCYAKLYAHTGTYGSNGVPTGAALATSDPIDASSLSSTLTETTFNFSTPYTLVNGTRYVITFEFAGGDSNNFVLMDGDLSGTHGGNACQYQTSWGPVGPVDMYFIAQGTP